MNSPERIINFDDVIELCGSVATSRGRAYKSSGSVLEIEWQPENSMLLSNVQGSAADPYQQRTLITTHRMDGECSCPVQYNCKHVAAALLCWVDKQNVPQSDDDRALRAVNRWLQKLVEQGRHLTPRLEDHTPGEPLLFYQIDSGALTQVKSGITLAIQQSRLLKRGGYGKETPYRYHGHYYHPDWVLASDRSILELAVGKNNDVTYRTLTIEGDIGHLIMNKLLATGRCFWGEGREQPLSLGPSRSLNFEWQDSAKGELSLFVELDNGADWQLVPSSPPWYIDIENLEAGSLQQVPDTSILMNLIDAPNLPREHAQNVSNYLASRLPESHMPLPVEPNFVRIEEHPRPVLILQSREDSADIREFFASIRFRYGDYLLPYDGMQAEATLEGKTSDGKPLVLKRDLVRETRYAVDFGKRFGDFEPAAATDSDYFSVADRKPRSRDVQTIARTWHELMNNRAELETSGWEINTREPFDLEFQSVTEIQATVSDSISNWFDMSLQLAHDGQSFDLLPLVVEWLESDVKDQPILVQAKSGQWLEVPPILFAPVAQTLQELFDDPTQGDFRLPRQRVGTLTDLDEHWQQQGLKVAWSGASELFSLANRLQEFEGIQTPVMPDTLKANLRPYQLEGVAWMGFLSEFRFNGILADDMGLGKTLETLAHLLHEKSIGRLSTTTLIVAPTSLLSNWQREAAKFTPTLSTHIWHGSNRKQQAFDFGSVDIVITSYALVTRDLEMLHERSFGYLVLDEAQAIKNPTAKITQAVKTIDAERKLCLTGTPLENHLGELWSQFDFLMPGFLGSRKHFNRYFKTPIESHGNGERQTRLVHLIRPFLLRRRKEQVAKDLPPKTEIVREVVLEGAQARLYESIRVTMEQRVRQLLASRGLARSHIEMLDALLKLRQTCCHPKLVKLDSARGIEESAKTELLMEMLVELISEGKKILLFSQFTEMLGLIENEVMNAGIPYVKLTGRTRKRDEAIDAFQHGDVPLFLISLKAGGTGLNLTAADTVIHYDPWWNPAVENQASDRAHRIGQTKPVFIYKLVASNTVEEKIMSMQQAKKSLADQTLNHGEQEPLTKLSTEEVISLFSASSDAQALDDSD